MSGEIIVVDGSVYQRISDTDLKQVYVVGMNQETKSSFHEDITVPIKNIGVPELYNEEGYYSRKETRQERRKRERKEKKLKTLPKKKK